MIGNDIVDLALASFASAKRQERYALKILNAHELEFYRKANKKIELLWRYWSIKEAVFKAFAQQHANAIFSPYKIQVTITSQKKAIACLEGETFSCSSIIGKNMVYTVATVEPCYYASDFQEKVTKPSKKDSITALKRAAAIRFGLDAAGLFVFKEDGKIPHLYDKDSHKRWNISLTHHGRFSGYALQL